jgi:chromosome segregation ATPase
MRERNYKPLAIIAAIALFILFIGGGFSTYGQDAAASEWDALSSKFRDTLRDTTQTLNEAKNALYETDAEAAELTEKIEDAIRRNIMLQNNVVQLGARMQEADEDRYRLQRDNDRLTDTLAALNKRLGKAAAAIVSLSVVLLGLVALWVFKKRIPFLGGLL